jgi:AcrR family transcriptional regulator
VPSASTHLYGRNRDTSLIRISHRVSAHTRDWSRWASEHFADTIDHNSTRRAKCAVSTTPRPRNARAAANDMAIANAAVSEVLRVGVDRVSLREVAIRAGLTHGATYARYEDVSELLVDLWQSKLSGAAVELLELSARAVEDPRQATLHAFLDRVRQPQPEDLAMAEMLLVSRRIPILYEEMEPFVKKHIHPGEDLTDDSRALFVRSLSLFGLAMVSQFGLHYFHDDQNHLNVVENVLTAALRSSPTDVPTGELVDEEVTRPDGNDDNLRARLVYATFFVVAKSGYHEATVSRIARRADCSPGAIYKLYRSKQDLVLDAFRAVFAPANSGAAPLPGSHDPSELLSRPARQRGNRMLFAQETTIAAAHNDTLRTAVGTYLADPERLMSHVGGVDDIEKSRIGEFVHAAAALTQGMQWMSSVMSTEKPAFDEFSENFQLELLNQWSSSSN